MNDPSLNEALLQASDDRTYDDDGSILGSVYYSADDKHRPPAKLTSSTIACLSASLRVSATFNAK